MAPTSTEDDSIASNQDGMIQPHTDISLVFLQNWFNFRLMCFLYDADSQSSRRSKRSVKRNAGATSALDKIRFFDLTPSDLLICINF